MKGRCGSMPSMVDEATIPSLATIPGADGGMLDAGGGHRVAWQASGERDGIPVVLLHGGPGSGSSPRHADPFDPARWRMVQFDQRGCGASTPTGATANNDTAALIADIESLRERLGFRAWFVAGGSWGAALALAYAARHRGRVTGLLLRSVFLTGRSETEAFFAAGRKQCPEAAAILAADAPASGGEDTAVALDRSLAGDGDPARQWRVACAWLRLESALDGVAPDAVPDFGTPAAERLAAKYRVQAHYLARECFLGEPALLAAAAALSGVPTAIVHGTGDLICPAANAGRVHAALAGSRLALVPGAGHGPNHPGMVRMAHRALAAFAADRNFGGWTGAGGVTVA